MNAPASHAGLAGFDPPSSDRRPVYAGMTGEWRNGRRTRFRFWHREVWGFDSPLAYRAPVEDMAYSFQSCLDPRQVLRAASERPGVQRRGHSAPSGVGPSTDEVHGPLGSRPGDLHHASRELPGSGGWPLHHEHSTSRQGPSDVHTGVAQLVERLPYTQVVGGSSPPPRTESPQMGSILRIWGPNRKYTWRWDSSSIGQSPRLITGMLRVRTPRVPPTMKARSRWHE